MAAEQDVVFESAKAYLMRADAEGSSLYDHLHKVVYQILEENPQDVAHHPERFTEVSSEIKRHSFEYGEVTSQANLSKPVHCTQLARAEENRKLFEKAAPEVVTKIEQPTPFTTVTTTTVVPKTAPPFRSVAKDNSMWRYCGVGLGEQEAFLLDQSITKLAMERKLEDVRFFGKIFGTSADYFIVSSKRYTKEGETVFEEVNTMPKPPRKKVDVDIQSEPPYKGCNRCSFWVTSDPSQSWTMLPDTTPQRINAARQITKFFTGNLDAPVIAYPTFDGKERDLLRAQLSRIFSATFIAPVNALEKVEPEEEEEPEDEEGKKGPKLAKYLPLVRPSKEFAPEDETGNPALLDTEQWAHSEGYVYKTGRQTKVPPKPEVEGEEEENKEEEEEEPKKEEEEKELFLPIKKDSVFAVITLPKEPNPEDEEEEAEAEPAEETHNEGEEEKEEEEKEEDEEEIPDDDPLRKKITAWSSRLTNAVYRKHAIVAVRSLRWPGAVAYSASAGKVWGCVYIGCGFKKTDHAFTPVPAPPILKECPDLTEVQDATAANEKLVMRGEELKEADSEDEKPDEEEQEQN